MSQCREQNEMSAQQYADVLRAGTEIRVRKLKAWLRKEPMIPQSVRDSVSQIKDYQTARIALEEFFKIDEESSQYYMTYGEIENCLEFVAGNLQTLEDSNEFYEVDMTKRSIGERAQDYILTVAQKLARLRNKN